MARPAAKRHSMEQAAIALFARKGLSSTTIKDIAAGAGVTQGALYRHYSGKTQMAWELYSREVDLFLEGEEIDGRRQASSVVDLTLDPPQLVRSGQWADRVEAFLNR